MANYLSSKDSNTNHYRKEVTEIYRSLEREITATETQLSDGRCYEDSDNPSEIYR